MATVWSEYESQTPLVDIVKHLHLTYEAEFVLGPMNPNKKLLRIEHL